MNCSPLGTVGDGTSVAVNSGVGDAILAGTLALGEGIEGGVEAHAASANDRTHIINAQYLVPLFISLT